MAFVVLHLEAIAKYGKDEIVHFKDSLTAHAKERLPGFARPEWIEVVHELPKVSLIYSAWGGGS